MTVRARQVILSSAALLAVIAIGVTSARWNNWRNDHWFEGVWRSDGEQEEESFYIAVNRDHTLTTLQVFTHPSGEVHEFLCAMHARFWVDGAPLRMHPLQWSPSDMDVSLDKELTLEFEDRDTMFVHAHGSQTERTRARHVRVTDPPAWLE